MALRRSFRFLPRRMLGPGGLTLTYVVVGILWILGSDFLLVWLIPEQADQAAFQSAKGVFYVAATGALLYLLIRRDVDALVRSEASLREARDRAEELNRTRSTLLTNMSHELRTPLTSIIGFAAILEEESEPGQKEFARIIESSGIRLMDTLNTLLDLALLDSSRLEIRREPVDLLAEATAAAEIYRPRADDRGIRLEIGSPFGQHVIASLDRSVLSRILSNLISNAVKFTHTGKVSVTVSRTPSHAEIRIEDTGVGISEAYMPYVFSEFQQESSGLARQFEGTGLGLAVTRRLVEAMQGEITVASKKGEGSAFTVRFPLNQD